MEPWLIALIVLVSVSAFIALVFFLWLFVLPRVIVHKMRAMPNPDGEMTYPENFEELKEKVTVQKNLVYPSIYPANKYNLYLPKNCNKKVPLIIWVHGGGFIGGTKDGGDNVMIALSAADYAVASIDYAVAPEHKYPTAIRQASEFTAHLQAIYEKNPLIDCNKVIFGGDSAGAQIAAQFVATQSNIALAREMKITQTIKPSALILVCGPFSFSAIRTFAAKTNKSFAMLVNIWGRMYFGGIRWHKGKKEKQANVILQANASFPPTFLTDGNKGSFEAQNKKLAEKLKSCGVSVEELYFDDSYGEVPHEYLFHLHEETSQIAYKRICEFLEKI